MLENGKLFDPTDRLTIELLQGHFLKGKIPSEVRRQGETWGAANRRRATIIHRARKHIGEAKQCLKEYREHCFSTTEEQFKEAEKELMRKLSPMQLMRYKEMPPHMIIISAHVISSHNMKEENSPYMQRKSARMAESSEKKGKIPAVV